mmetsp:Transcript_17936/g.56520  ORF Transcript_17936/g.56520 Transcript_17936/m.56520 type:complete len:233 (-) Transcript_17936:419-1117(-)
MPIRKVGLKLPHTVRVPLRLGIADTPQYQQGQRPHPPRLLLPNTREAPTDFSRPESDRPGLMLPGLDQRDGRAHPGLDLRGNTGVGRSQDRAHRGPSLHGSAGIGRPQDRMRRDPSLRSVGNTDVVPPHDCPCHGLRGGYVVGREKRPDLPRPQRRRSARRSAMGVDNLLQQRAEIQLRRPPETPHKLTGTVGCPEERRPTLQQLAPGPSLPHLLGVIHRKPHALCLELQAA